MEDGTVILTTIFDEAWTRPGSVLGLFLKSFQIGQGTKRLLNHLVIVTLGSQAFQNCNCLHPHCFQLRPFGSRKGPLALDNLVIQRNTNNLLLQVLDLGYSFIFTEADVMWLRTPIVHIHPSYEITIPCNLHSEDSQNRSNKPGRGLFYVKSNAVSIELFKYRKVWGTLYPNSHVKSLCEALKEQQDVIEMLGVRIQYLNATYFGGFCQGDSREIRQVYTLQANCCDNVEDKVHDLKLVLEDWINFRAQSFNISLGKRAPTKCIA
ncbi:uncharacterized protein At4g15970 [Morus notabilis]|nr:uncharacterized protein At4g15970 [Morus notabilis]